MTFQTPETAITGTPIPSSWWNTYVRDNMLALHNIPTCRVYNNADILIPDNTPTALSFGSERWDTDEIHSIIANTDRLTCKTAGMYGLIGHVTFDSNTTGNRIINIVLNGAQFIASQSALPLSGSPTRLSVPTRWKMEVNDYVQLIVYQNRGGSLNIIYESARSPEFEMTWLGAA